MSDQQIGKREEELIYLAPFTEAYRLATGESLLVGAGPDPPDFIGVRETGEEIAVELTCIMRDPALAQAAEILWRQEYMDSDEALELIYHTIEIKEEKRTKNYGIWADNTILVINLVECPLSSLRPYLNTLQGDFNFHGFVEVWLADHSDDAYSDIELFGLSPLEIRGYYPRPPGQKPYD
jgi:hypothetical protein